MRLALQLLNGHVVEGDTVVKRGQLGFRKAVEAHAVWKTAPGDAGTRRRRYVPLVAA